MRALTSLNAFGMLCVSHEHVIQILGMYVTEPLLLTRCGKLEAPV